MDFLFQNQPPAGNLENSATIQEISVKHAVQKLNTPAVLFVDARSADEYSASHVESAVNLPQNETDDWLDRIMTEIDPQTFIITYCSDRHCHLAKDLADTLHMAGFNRVYYLKEGLAEWEKQGHPVVKDD
jgi:rhodanese-related sulfurtransferase